MSHGFRQSASENLVDISELTKRDMPPPGGYETIKYKRNLPTRGPGGAVVFGVVGAICAYGFWRVGQGNLERRWVYQPTFRPVPRIVVVTQASHRILRFQARLRHVEHR